MTNLSIGGYLASALAKNKIADANNDGIIDEKEQALLLFSSEVADMHDAYINSDYKTGDEYYENILTDLDKKQEIAEKIYNFDKNKDGKISVDEISANSDFAELKNIFAGSTETFSIEEFLKFQNLFDTNNDGEIDDEESEKFGSLLTYDKTGDYTKEQLKTVLQKAISKDMTSMTSEETNIFAKITDGSIFELEQTMNQPKTPATTDDDDSDDADDTDDTPKTLTFAGYSTELASLSSTKVESLTNKVFELTVGQNKEYLSMNSIYSDDSLLDGQYRVVDKDNAVVVSNVSQLPD